MLLGSAILGGLARVAANVHHVQDVVGGLVIAAVAVGAGAGLQSLLDRGRRRGVETDLRGRARVGS